jgi:hypothetical protein
MSFDDNERQIQFICRGRTGGKSTACSSRLVVRPTDSFHYMVARSAGEGGIRHSDELESRLAIKAL